MKNHQDAVDNPIYFLLISGLSARKVHHRSKLFATPSSSQLASRRLSSPPSLDKSGEEFFSDKIRKSRRQRNNGVDDCDIDGGGGSGSSNGSLNKLCISGLNPSSSDLHQIISGHQVLSKYLLLHVYIILLVHKVTLFRKKEV